MRTEYSVKIQLPFYFSKSILCLFDSAKLQIFKTRIKAAVQFRKTAKTFVLCIRKNNKISRAVFGNKHRFVIGIAKL